MAGSIELQKPTTDLGNDISGEFNGTAIGVVDSKSFSGEWKGQFFGHRATRSTETGTIERQDDQGQTVTVSQTTTMYSPQHPGSVAGTFFVKQLSNPAGEAAFIGAFGAHR